MAIAKKQITALNDVVAIDVPTDQTVLPAIQLPQGWAGTVVLEGTIDGVTYDALSLTPALGGAAVASAAARGIWFGPAGSYDKLQLRVSVAGAGGIAALSASPY